MEDYNLIDTEGGKVAVTGSDLKSAAQLQKYADNANTAGSVANLGESVVPQLPGAATKTAAKLKGGYTAVKGRVEGINLNDTVSKVKNVNLRDTAANASKTVKNAYVTTTGKLKNFSFKDTVSNLRTKARNIVTPETAATAGGDAAKTAGTVATGTELVLAEDAAKTAGTAFKSSTVAMGATEGVSMFSKAGKLLGDVAAPITVVAGGFEMRSAYKKKDGHAMAKAGGSTVGALATLGASTEAFAMGTAVSAPLGPLAPVGGLVAAAGVSIAGIWGGSKIANATVGDKLDKKLKQNAPVIVEQAPAPGKANTGNFVTDTNGNLVNAAYVAPDAVDPTQQQGSFTARIDQERNAKRQLNPQSVQLS